MAVGVDPDGVGDRELGDGAGAAGVEPAFDRVTPGFRGPERLPAGDPKLHRHQVEAGDGLGHGVLDLDPTVHLQEVEVARLDVEDELDCAQVVVADSAGERHSGVVQLCAGRVVESGGR